MEKSTRARRPRLGTAPHSRSTRPCATARMASAEASGTYSTVIAGSFSSAFTASATLSHSVIA